MKGVKGVVAKPTPTQRVVLTALANGSYLRTTGILRIMVWLFTSETLRDRRISVATFQVLRDYGWIIEVADQLTATGKQVGWVRWRITTAGRKVLT